MDESELLAKARGGDRASFEALVVPHREAISRFVELIAGGESEDVVQEAFTRAFHSIAAFD